MVYVNIPYNVLIGSDDPCHLVGLGPISADQARLITADATLRRLITDPVTGNVLDIGRTRYRPPAHLAEHIKVRDQLCSTPGCQKPAQLCDLDHTTPFKPGQPHGGTTSADNLAPLCRHHHRAKDKGGHRLYRNPNGTYTWTTPLNRTYQKARAELEPSVVMHAAPEPVPASTNAVYEEPPF